MHDINDIIKENEGLVYKQLHRFNLCNDPDAISYAYEALYVAICNYDAASGYKLSTYATVCIYNAICGYMRSMQRKRQIQTVSYNELVDGTEYLNFLSSGQSAEDVLIGNENVSDVYNTLRYLKNKYSGVTLRIFELWCNRNFDIGPTDVAKILNVSQSYASVTLARIRNDFKEKWRNINANSN